MSYTTGAAASARWRVLGRLESYAHPKSQTNVGYGTAQVRGCRVDGCLVSVDARESRSGYDEADIDIILLLEKYWLRLKIRYLLLAWLVEFL